jgi:hypothetical protein
MLGTGPGSGAIKATTPVAGIEGINLFRYAINILVPIAFFTCPVPFLARFSFFSQPVFPSLLLIDVHPPSSMTGALTLRDLFIPHGLVHAFWTLSLEDELFW